MSERIIWQAEGVEMPPLDFALMKEWIGKVASSHHREVGSLSYIFCNDAYILEVNRNFLQHDYFTDIITFDYCRGNFLRGDMVISLDTVSSNAMTLGLNPQTELYRVIIHGVLHLCGINDKGPGEREIMERHENDALDILTAIIKEKQIQNSKQI